MNQDMTKKPNKMMDQILGIAILLPLMFFILIALIGFASVTSSGAFFSLNNASNIMRQAMLLCMISVGMMVTMRAGGIDLSAVAVGVLGAVLIFKTGAFSAAGLLLALIVILIVGLFNGLLAVFVKVPSFVSSLLLAALIRGISYYLTEGTPIMLESRGLPNMIYIIVPIFVMLIAFVFVLISPLGKTMAERKSVDDREKIVYLLAYVFNAVCGLVFGILLTYRISSVQPTIGVGYEVTMLAACFAAGCSTLFDNRFFPVLISAAITFLFQVYANALILIGVSAYAQQIFFAFIAILIVALDRVYKRNFTAPFLNSGK